MKGFLHPVVIIANVDPERPAPSGVRAHTIQLKESLERRGVPVTVLGRGSSSAPGFIPATKAHQAGDIRFTLALFRAPRLKGCLLHAQYPLYAVPWILRRHRRLVCVLHGDNVLSIGRKRGRLVAWLYWRVERFAVRRCDRVVAVSEQIARAYSSRCPELRSRIDVIPLEPDSRIFKPRGPTPTSNPGNESGGRPPMILFVGRLRKDKRPDFVIRTFSVVHELLPRATLVVVGEGKERPALESTCSALKIEAWVRFLGSVTRERVAELMAAADVLVVASAYESGPLVVAEARRCGARVVSTDVGRVREFQSRYGGVEIPQVEERSFAEAIFRAVRAGPLVPADTAMLDASEEAFIRTYEEVLEELPTAAHQKNSLGEC